jgi:diguanylate cyclase (GGDEF)-like protein/PAS domain S-box-containing protein
MKAIRLAQQHQLIDLLPSDDWSYLLDAMPDAVLITVYESGSILHANTACEDVYGFPIEKMLGKTTVELGIFANRQQRQDLLASQLDQSRFRTEHIFYNALGEQRFGLFSGQHIAYRDQHCLIITGRDITRIKAVEQALIESKNRYDMLAEGTRDIPWEINPCADVVYVGPSIQQWGYRNSDWMGQHITHFIHPDDRSRFIERIDALLGGQTIADYLHIRIRSQQGDFSDVEITTAPIYDSFGYIIAIYGIMRDISHHIQDREKFEKLAVIDDLTNLYNRRYFTAQLEKVIQSTNDTPHPSYIMFMDLDDFKQINDNFGHEAGDLALQRISEQLRSSLRKRDIVCRIGGDEFAAIISETEEDIVKAICSRIFGAIDNLSFGNDIKVGISIGLARLGATSTVESILHSADVAMYEAKREGKNRFRIIH